MSAFRHKAVAKQLVRQLWINFYLRSTDLYRYLTYRKYAPGHIFPISVDGTDFKMSFADYPLKGAIVERIEARREKETVAIIKSIIGTGSKVLELGGCYGYFTIIMSNCVGPTGRVVTIEGTPNNYNVLRDNLKLNNIENVDAYNFFLTSKDDFVTFNPHDKHPYGAIERLQVGSQDGTLKVKTVKITSLLRELDYSPDHIFMDIEGFEIEVIEDLSQYYSNCDAKPTILTEIHGQYYRDGKGLQYIIALLKDLGYSHRVISGNILFVA